MNLRPELTPPSINKEYRAKIRQRIESICRAVEAGEDQHEQIEEFNRFVGRDYNVHSFLKYWTAMSLEDFVEEACRSIPKPAANVTREELIEIVKRAMPTIGDIETADQYREIFDANVKMPQASNMIYYPLDFDEESNTWSGGRPIGEYAPTPEEIVDQALMFEKQ